MIFQTMLTKTGLAKISNALALQQTIELVEMAAGDGGGEPTNPTQEQTALVNENYRANLSRLEPDPENPAYVIVEMVVPSTEGGWYVREVGIYDIDGDMIAIANFPETYKPTALEGSTRDLVIRLYIEVVNSDVVELKVDPAVILATHEWVVTNFISAPGGTTGQVLSKATDEDGDVTWIDPPSGPTSGYVLAGDGTQNANSIPGDDPHWLEITNNPGDGAAGNQLFRMNSYGDIAYGNNIHSCRYFGSEDAPTAIQDSAILMSWGFRGYNGIELSQSAGAFQALATEDWTSQANGMRFEFEITLNGTTGREPALNIGNSINIMRPFNSVGFDSPVEQHANYASIDMGSRACSIRGNRQAGKEITLTANMYYDTAFRYGLNGGAAMFQLLGTNQTATISFAPSTGVADAEFIPANCAIFNAVTGTGFNTTTAAMQVNKDATSSRSINAAGTVNASGADYAEYMRKTSGCGEIRKGDVTGVNADGEITDIFDQAVTFLIKSTNPAYVGGDIWGRSEQIGVAEPQRPDDGDLEAMAEYEAKLTEFQAAIETERQRWDRMAFSGRVPVNVSGAEPGDYLVPEATSDGGIGARAVKSPNFEQYMASIGRVISVLDDGRPVVIVKVG